MSSSGTTCQTTSRPSTDTLGVVSNVRRRVMRIHLGLVLAEVICVPAFVLEIHRALGGNELSWAYVFEWPLFGGYAIYMWRQLLRQERGELAPRRPSGSAPGDEAALAAWNAYLERVHQSDEPNAGHVAEPDAEAARPD
jgi:hypothetical protein